MTYHPNAVDLVLIIGMVGCLTIGAVCAVAMWRDRREPEVRALDALRKLHDRDPWLGQP